MKKLLFASILSFSFFALLGAKENKVALITGASKGVGLATAKLLAENGFTVYGTTRQIPSAEDPQIHFLSVDLQDACSIRSAVQILLEKEGHIDVLINNAGYGLVGPVELLTEQEMHQQMNINFFAPIHFIQAALPSMREQKSGHIINISSINAFLTPPFGSLYAASKAALESLSESLSVELLPYGISVSIVEPGLIRTHFALPIGSRELLGNPYRDILERLHKEIEERLANPEILSPSQSPEEVAQEIFKVVQAPHPKLRYQTSPSAQLLVSKKLLDLNGDLYLEELRRSFESPPLESLVAPQEALQDFSPLAQSLQIGKVYVHYKGMRYQLQAIARHSETLEELVVYQALYGEKDTWVRPLSMFLENVTIEGEGRPRFSLEI